MFDPVVVIAIVVILVVTGLAISTGGGRRRTLSALASRLGARFSVHDPISLPQMLSELYFLQRGHSTHTYNVIRGRLSGIRFITFDYRYEIGCGADRAVLKGSCVICQTQLQLHSALALLHEPLEPIGTYRYFTAVTEHDRRLAQLGRLYTDQPDSLHRLLTGPVGEVLLLCRGVDWQFHGNYLAFHSRDTLDPAQIIRLVHRGARCCRLLRDAQTTARLNTASAE